LPFINPADRAPATVSNQPIRLDPAATKKFGVPHFRPFTSHKNQLDVGRMRHCSNDAECSSIEVIDERDASRE